MSRVLVPIATGFEELEAVTIIDILRRAHIEVVVAGLQDGPVTGSRDVVLHPDCTLDTALQMDFDMVVLPGGMPGAEHLWNDTRVLKLLKTMHESGKFTAAICAAPKALALAGVLNTKRVTAYPSFVDTEEFPNLNYTGVPVEQDGTIITSRGPGTAMDFALVLVEQLCGPDARVAVETPLLRP